MSETPAAEWLLWLAAAMIVISSIVAITKDQLKARLAWSTIGQLAYMTAAALMAGSAAVVAGGVHMLTHAFGKITLFMCAGAIYVATSRTKVSELSGMGRSMPWLFAAWTVGALSVSGLPPFGGMWSKFLLMEAAVDRGYMFVVWALIGSSLLSVYYLVSISFRAFLPPPGEGEGAVRIKSREMVRLCVVALCLTALGAFLLFFLADGVAHYLAPIGEEGP
ncbi:MAG: proton-conducting transporter membrane subunit [Hyphomonadaceae bacterium]